MQQSSTTGALRLRLLQAAGLAKGEGKFELGHTATATETAAAGPPSARSQSEMEMVAREF